MSFGFLDFFSLAFLLIVWPKFDTVWQCLLLSVVVTFSTALIVMLLFTSECGFWTASSFIFIAKLNNESILSVHCRLEGNRMNIPHRILTADGSQKPFNKSLAESDSSSDYVTPSSSMADVSSSLHINVLAYSLLVAVVYLPLRPWHDLQSVHYSVSYSVSFSVSYSVSSSIF